MFQVNIYVKYSGEIKLNQCSHVYCNEVNQIKKAVFGIFPVTFGIQNDNTRML